MVETLVKMVLAAALILLALLGWIRVQQAARSYAARHPEFGPAKEEGGGCGSSCSCSAACGSDGGGSCKNPDKSKFKKIHQEFEP